MDKNPAEPGYFPGESTLHETWEYRVSSTAAIGSLAVGIAYLDNNEIFTALTRVTDVGIGEYVCTENFVDEEKSERTRHSADQWAEFTAAIKRGELQDTPPEGAVINSTATDNK